MFTEILTPTNASIEDAAEYIRQGELVAIPTETVYGLGGNALDPVAIEKIFAAKDRPHDNPLIAHISDVSELRPLIACEVSTAARRMIAAFWPGPLTMIFPRAEKVPAALSAGLDTVSVRLPNHPVARALIRAAGVPIAAPSANSSGRPSPTTAAHVFEDMNGKIPLILNGGACAIGLESTVVDMTGDTPIVLRPGAITAEQIAEVVGASEIDDAVMRPLHEEEKPRSPGMKHRHYAPKGVLTIVTGSAENVSEAISEMYDQALSDGHHPLIMALSEHIPSYGDRRTESLGGSVEEMAQRIFAVLRNADAMGADILFSEAVEATGLGLAVMNRLGRAAAFHIVEV